MIKYRVIRQFGHPKGAWGVVAGRIMATRTSNVERNRWVAAVLDPKPDARILEIGHGPGIAIAELWPKLTGGSIDAVEVSSLMSQAAARRNRDGVAADQVRFHVGDAQRLPEELHSYDVIFGVNVSMFWDDPQETVCDLAGRLVAGGELTLAYMPPPTSDTPAKAMAATFEHFFEVAGLLDVESETMAFEPPAIATRGRSPLP